MNHFDKEWDRFLQEIEFECNVDVIYEKLHQYLEVRRMMKFLKVGNYNIKGEK